MIDLSLNNGVYCSPLCLEVLQSVQNTTDLRHYSDRDNSELKGAAAKDCGVRPNNIFLHNGSGPILKQFIPDTIRRGVMSSPRRILKHLMGKGGYPLILPVPTYDKVMQGAAAAGLKIREVPLQPGTLKLDTEQLARALEQGDGLVYLCNPNNPTGSVLIDRRDLTPLIQRFPKSTFFIDEAYVQYLSPERHEYMADLPARYPNVVCMRTFSFAHGLASAHVGFIVANEDVVTRLEKQTTAYRVPALTEKLALAALEDKEHLELVRIRTAAAREHLLTGMKQHRELTPFPSETNFILVRVDGDVSARTLAENLKHRGLLVRTFESGGAVELSHTFRVTVGTDEENAAFLSALGNLLPKHRHLRLAEKRTA